MANHQEPRPLQPIVCALLPALQKSTNSNGGSLNGSTLTFESLSSILVSGRHSSITRSSIGTTTPSLRTKSPTRSHSQSHTKHGATEVDEPNSPMSILCNASGLDPPLLAFDSNLNHSAVGMNNPPGMRSPSMGLNDMRSNDQSMLSSWGGDITELTENSLSRERFMPLAFHAEESAVHAKHVFPALLEGTAEQCALLLVADDVESTGCDFQGAPTSACTSSSNDLHPNDAARAGCFLVACSQECQLRPSLVVDAADE